MYTIKLQLVPPNNTFEYVRRIPGIDELDIDKDYGLVLISPKRGLYTIRVFGDIDIKRIRALPDVKGVYGEVRIAPINKGNNK